MTNQQSARRTRWWRFVVVAVAVVLGAVLGAGTASVATGVPERAARDAVRAVPNVGIHVVRSATYKVYVGQSGSTTSGAMVIAGGVLIATGAGGPAGMMLVSAGIDTVVQKATTGQVNWGQVAVSGALGAIMPGGGAITEGVGVAGLKAATTMAAETAAKDAATAVAQTAAKDAAIFKDGFQPVGKDLDLLRSCRGHVSWWEWLCGYLEIGGGGGFRAERV